MGKNCFSSACSWFSRMIGRAIGASIQPVWMGGDMNPHYTGFTRIGIHDYDELSPVDNLKSKISCAVIEKIYPSFLATDPRSKILHVRDKINRSFIGDNRRRHIEGIAPLS